MKEILNFISHYRRAKEFYLRYERLLMPATMVGGFLLDYVTFATIRIQFTFTLLAIYWALAGITIAFIHLFDAGRVTVFVAQAKYLRLFAPLFIQFLFGALLSVSLVFYWFSGVFSVSWPIMAAIALLMVFNDVFRRYFEKPLLHIGVYFFVSISLFSVILPFVFNTLSVWLFILAGVGSFLLFLPYLYYLSRRAEHIRKQRNLLLGTVVVILLVMNVLYFTDIIPPIPLALREAGLYHDISRANGKYVLMGEPRPPLMQQAVDLLQGQTLHILSGQKIYLYTAIFAPAKLETVIVHHWQYYDQQRREWITKDKLSFTITGGRKEGYKGYSWISDLQPGRWRVYVENRRGQVLGRLRFIVEGVVSPVDLQETLR